MQITPIQKLICGLLGTANVKLMNSETQSELLNQASNLFNNLQFLINTFSNEKETNEATSGQALTVACSGWDIHPWNMRLDKSRMVFSAKLNRQPTRVPGYCNNLIGEKFLLNPNIINKNKQTKAEIKKIFEDRHNGRFLHYLDLVVNWGWNQDTNTSPKHIMSPLMTILSNFYPLQDYCAENHPELDQKKCALIYGWYRKYHEYDDIAKNRPADFKIPDYVNVKEYVQPEEEKNEFEEYLDFRNRFEDL